MKKRRQYFIKPQLQFRIICLVLGLSFIFANITGGLIYLFLSSPDLFAGVQAALGLKEPIYVLLFVVIVAELIGLGMILV
ncbi:MAG: hypothetical protein QGH40_02850, partial [bacterium]|nr:hypothetical protein [bacterium]